MSLIAKLGRFTPSTLSVGAPLAKTKQGLSSANNLSLLILGRIQLPVSGRTSQRFSRHLIGYQPLSNPLILRRFENSNKTTLYFSRGSSAELSKEKIKKFFTEHPVLLKTFLNGKPCSQMYVDLGKNPASLDEMRSFLQIKLKTSNIIFERFPQGEEDPSFGGPVIRMDVTRQNPFL